MLGYEVLGDLPPIIDYGKFTELTQGKLASTREQAEAMLEAVSSTVRGYCGWHMAPVVRCRWTGQPENGLVKLPCMLVRSIDRVTVNGVEIEDFEWLSGGLVRLPCNCEKSRRWRSTVVEFTAGATQSAESLGAIVAQIAANSLVAVPGVREEHAGSVGMSYNQTANGVSGGVSILDRDRAILDSWRLANI